MSKLPITLKDIKEAVQLKHKRRVSLQLLRYTILAAREYYEDAGEANSVESLTPIGTEPQDNGRKGAPHLVYRWDAVYSVLRFVYFKRKWSPHHFVR